MYCETVSSKQLRMWLAAALIPVAFQLAASSGWRNVLICGIVCTIAVWTVWKWGSFGRWASVGAYLLLVIVMGQLAKESATVWTGNSYPWVPLVLLGLALWSALKGALAAARVGCVLFWGVLLIYLLTCGAAVSDVNWKWSIANEGNLDGRLALLLLLPALGVVVLKDKCASVKGLVLPVAFALSGTLLTSGYLVGSALEMTRSVSLLGTLKRFEAIVCAGASLGWFLLMNYSLVLCGFLGQGKAAIIMGMVVIAGWMLCDVHIQYNILLLFGGIFWVLIPILTQIMDTRKKMKKSEITP